MAANSVISFHCAVIRMKRGPATCECWYTALLESVLSNDWLSIMTNTNVKVQSVLSEPNTGTVRYQN